MNGAQDGASRFEAVFETIKSGDALARRAACEEVVRSWRDVPLEPLLVLKGQFGRMGLEHHEANLDEALVSVCERRPTPFLTLATDPANICWAAAVEVLSLVGGPEYLDLFISLLPLVGKKGVLELIRAIERYTGPKAAAAVGPLVLSDDEEVFIEAALALKKIGGEEAVRRLKDGLQNKKGGSENAGLLTCLLDELEFMNGDR